MHLIRRSSTLLGATLIAAVLLSGCFLRQTKDEPDDPFLSTTDPQAAVRRYTEKTDVNPDDAQAWLELGRAQLGLKRYHKASEALQRAAQLDSSRAETWALLGLSFRKEGKMDEASAAYGQALDRSPQSTEYLNAYRAMMEERGRHRELVARIADKIAVGPAGIKLLNNMAKEYLRAGAVSAAEDAARASLRLKPDQTKTEFMLGNALERQERCEEGLRVYQKLNDRDQTHTGAVLGLARCQLVLGDQVAAEAALQEVLRRDPRNVQAMQGLVQVFIAKGEFSAASRMLREALSLAPGAVGLQVSQAEVYLRQGLPSQALSVLKMAGSVAPNDVRLNTIMGEALLKTGEPDRALEAFDRALRSTPGDNKLIRFRCQALREANRRSAVEKECKDVPPPEGWTLVRSVEVKPKKAPRSSRSRRLKTTTAPKKTRLTPAQVAAKLPASLRPRAIPESIENPDKTGARAAFGAGQAHFKAGQYWEAAESFRKATILDPLNHNYYYNLGVSFAAMKEYDMAAETFKQVLTLNSKDVDALYNLGTTFFRTANYPEAITAYKYLHTFKPGDKEAYRSMGAAYEAIGQLAKARECYTKGGGPPAMEEVE